MNYHSSNFGDEGSWNENVWKGLKVEISLKIQMIFLSSLKFAPFKRAWKYSNIYKLTSDDKISSSLIKKWCTCNFLGRYWKSNEQYLCALFQQNRLCCYSFLYRTSLDNTNENYDFLTNTFIKIIIKKKFLRENHAPFVTDNLEKKFIPEVNKEMKFVKIVLK